MLKDMVKKVLGRTQKVEEMSQIHLFPEQKIVYVEIPKAGCTSVKYALREFRGNWTGEGPGFEFHKWFGYTYIPSVELSRVLKKDYKGWTKFTVVRNPYDRFWSLCCGKLKKENPDSTVDQILDNFRINPWYQDPHGRPQSRLLGNDLSLFDFIGQTENMNEVFAFLSKKFGKAISPRQDNIRGSKVEKQLTEAQREKIYELYEPDFNLLGYPKIQVEKPAAPVDLLVQPPDAALNKNIFWQNTAVKKDDRQRRFFCKSLLIWFTGLSGSGKSALAGELQRRLFHQGYPVYLLDGDNIRHGLNSDLGFSADDRKENIRRVGEVAKLFVDAGLVTLASFISPSEADRQFVRSLFKPGEFVEVYVKASVEACEKRDTKGLYKKAREGKIKDFTGISSPYEEPKNAEIVIDTETQDIETCIIQLQHLCYKQYKLGGVAQPEYHL